MPDDPAFVRMIAARPDDDAPRLVYADVLDETGDPAKAARAEFIRVQIERARLAPDTPRWTELWHRDTALLDWARRWRLELPPIRGVQFGGFVRGFVDRVDADCESAATHLRQLLDAVPIRRLAVLSPTLSAARALADVADLAEVPELDLSTSGVVEPAVLRAFARRGPWPVLRRLAVAALARPYGRANATWRAAWRELEKAFGDRLVTDSRVY
jgi:uncharacterized protein (TIGR02996 family)